MLSRSLHLLESVLHAHYGRRAVALIDDCDAPLLAAAAAGHYALTSGFFTTFFGVGLKDSPHLHKAVLTAWVMSAKEGAFAAVSEFKGFGLSQARLRDALGFTGEEARQSLARLNLGTLWEILQGRHGGRTVGGVTLYAPADVARLCADAAAGSNAPEGLWVQGDDEDLITGLIDAADEVHLEMLRTLMKGGGVETELHDDVPFAGLCAGRTPRLQMEVLHQAGFLSRVADAEGNRPLLRIPNEALVERFRETAA